ncbi:putative ubiquitin-protein ligase [Corchorus olitorius]|uniref:Ubiquitin-protein ligase n=1 Tax=Corchorus olitorius TaxID=93759 RepID=A0A1R3IAW6_9ROSI|nr:putative ubiquitin-protein ligase [Corchorus olitorius]
MSLLAELEACTKDMELLSRRMLSHFLRILSCCALPLYRRLPLLSCSNCYHDLAYKCPFCSVHLLDAWFELWHSDMPFPTLHSQTVCLIRITTLEVVLCLLG